MLNIKETPIFSGRLLSVRELCERLGVSRATIWRWTKENPDFPKPIRLSAGTTRWSEAAVIHFVSGTAQ